ncbi:cytochrome c [Photobacterium sp. 1_MG-2023]|uniref:c-type cytochrome n=1 Tax=Photobacterium sp. 1_MG-2023 TaxID=3062646 RepID=UPI0026E35D19|nr:c-type cytochrome [Photobacterium sp. 1_MG-2023]MDO6704858.1 c-type cytochrome [Photobacterium sp. 1_MG-2023]
MSKDREPKTVRFCWLTGVFLLLVTSGPEAKTESEAKAQIKQDLIGFCADCHGRQGISELKNVPNLRAQPPAYLKAQLEAFRSKTRSTTFMDAFIYQISDAQIEQAVAHFSSQPASLKTQPVWRGEKWPGDMSPGEQLAYVGKLAPHVPACVACHGPSGIGVEPSFPRLEGQKSDYMVNQLKAWKADKRPPGPLGVMAAIAKSLTDDEILAVSEYFAQLGGEQ